MRSSEPAHFAGRAGEYIRADGAYAIEEIGASTRDAVQATLAIARDEAHRFGGDDDATPAQLIEERRRAARSFLGPTTRFYQTVHQRLVRGLVLDDRMVRGTNPATIEVRVTAGTNLVIAAKPGPRVAAGARRGRG